MQFMQRDWIYRHKRGGGLTSSSSTSINPKFSFCTEDESDEDDKISSSFIIGLDAGEPLSKAGWQAPGQACPSLHNTRASRAEISLALVSSSIKDVDDDGVVPEAD